MSTTNFTVNTQPVTATPPARTHLADYLRETLGLTATHLGCEHGVCGACTLLIDGQPSRSCITFTPACAGRHIQTIEGLEHDPAIAALRTAFSAHHALQCGYCTPGMLITARDILLRLPNADNDRIRLELAGNLCRCTGYNGIVNAIRDVLDQRLNFTTPASAPLTQQAITEITTATTSVIARPTGNGLTQSLHLAVPLATLWAALQNPALVANCVPGATLTSLEANKITGEMAIAFGPIKGNFTGTASLTYGDHTGTILGEGQDQISKTRLTAAADFTITAIDAQNSQLALTITYSLRGALAQFARGPLVAAFADEIAAIIAANLQAQLTGNSITAPAPLNPIRLLWRILWRRLKNFVTS